MQLIAQKSEEKFWENLVYQLDEVDTKILKEIYYPTPEPFIFDIFFKQLKTVHLTKSGLRKRIKKLEKFRLLEEVKKTKPLCVNPNNEVNLDLLDNLMKLLCYRLGLKNIRR